MFRNFMAASGAVLIISACATAQVAPEEAPGWLSKDFAELTEMFEGRWDNDRHVFFAEDAGMDTISIAPAQHISITRQSEAGAESVTFQAERSVDGGAAVSLFHTFSIDAEKKMIAQTMHLTPSADGNEVAGCQILWQRRGSQFQGMADGRDCEAFFPRPEADGELSIAMTLSDADFWVKSQRGAAVTEARFRRARPFECWTAILRGAEHGDSGEGMRDWDFRRGVKLHDQGGEAELITDEDAPRKIRLKLRNVDWPYGTNRPSLTLYIMEGESDRAVSYAWNEGDAERIGINLRWIQASCTHKPE